MGWFKIENSDLVISDSVLDSTTRYLRKVFEELASTTYKPNVYIFVSLLEELLHKNSSITLQEAEEDAKYTSYLKNRAGAGLPDEIRERIENHLQKNILEIGNDYQNGLDRKPKTREILAVLIVSLDTFSHHLADPMDLKKFLAQIKVSRSPKV